MKRNLLALSGMMPPLVFPRSLQISRTLEALKSRNWSSDVVTVVPESELFGAKDERLAEFYKNSYQTFHVEPREEVAPSPVWLKLWRKLKPPVDLKTANWERRSYARLSELISAKSYAAFASFGQPWVNHKVGLRLKRRFPKIPWLAHFSDPWVDSPYAEFRDDAHKAREQKWESEIIYNADAVVFVNERTAELVLRKYPATVQNKVTLVSHGYDARLLELLEPATTADSNPMRIVHAGNFYSQRSPKTFLNALAGLNARKPLKGLLIVDFIGQVDEQMIELVRNLGLADFVHFHGRMGYLETLGFAQRANLLLLIDAASDNSVFLPSKLIDYLMLGKRIMGITPKNGCSADALAELNYPVVDPDNMNAISDAIDSELQGWGISPSLASKEQPSPAQKYDITQTTVFFEKALSKISK